MIQLYEVDFLGGIVISILPEWRFPHAGQVRETTPEYSPKIWGRRETGGVQSERTPPIKVRQTAPEINF